VFPADVRKVVNKLALEDAPSLREGKVPAEGRARSDVSKGTVVEVEKCGQGILRATWVGRNEDGGIIKRIGADLVDGIRPEGMAFRREGGKLWLVALCVKFGAKRTREAWLETVVTPEPDITAVSVARERRRREAVK